MVDAHSQMPLGRRSERTKQFLEVHLAIFIAEYNQAIRELTEQLHSLQVLAKALGGAQ